MSRPRSNRAWIRAKRIQNPLSRKPPPLPAVLPIELPPGVSLEHPPLGPDGWKWEQRVVYYDPTWRLELL